MLKYIDIYGLIADSKITEEIGYKIINFPDHMSFNTDIDNGLLVFRSEAQSQLEEKFGVDLSEADNISFYVKSFDGGEVYQLYGKEIPIGECINLLLTEIDMYETEIMKSNDFLDTIRILIKKQIPKVIEDEIRKLNDTILAMKSVKGNDYSNIEWQ